MRRKPVLGKDYKVCTCGERMSPNAQHCRSCYRKPKFKLGYCVAHSETGCNICRGDLK